MGTYISILSGLLKIFEFYISYRKKKQNTESLELTDKEQKIHGKIIAEINRQERVVNSKLHHVSSLRERAEAINSFKNDDM